MIPQLKKLPGGGEVVATEWRSGAGSVCFVAVDYGHYWQAYVGPERIGVALLGTVVMADHTSTEVWVAQHGAKLSWKEASVFFPQFDITKYKTYPERTYGTSSLPTKHSEKDDVVVQPTGK